MRDSSTATYFFNDKTAIAAETLIQAETAEACFFGLPIYFMRSYMICWLKAT